MMEWDDHLELVNMACQNTFGIPVSYIPSLTSRPELNGAPIEITGVFSNSAEQQKILTVDEILPSAGTPRPIVDIVVKSLGVEPMVDDTVMIKGKIYRILEVLHDGTGAAALHLKMVQQEN